MLAVTSPRRPPSAPRSSSISALGVALPFRSRFTRVSRRGGGVSAACQSKAAKNTHTDQCTVGAVRCAAREPSSDGAGSQERLHCELEARPRSGEPRQSPRKAAGRPSAIWLAARPRCPLLVPPERLRHARTLQALFSGPSRGEALPDGSLPGDRRSALPRRRRHFPFAPCAAKPLVSLFQTGGSCSWPLPRPAKPLRPN